MIQAGERRPLRVAVIIGSTRESRVGAAIGQWFAAQAGQRDDLELTVLDLLDFDFPARYPDRATPAINQFVAQIGETDAYVVVTPEYNRSFPASLKQAIDYAYDEWRAKPVGFVSYGYRSDGIYAVEHLRTVFTALHAVTVRDIVGFNLLDGSFADGGPPADADGAALAATTMLDQLAWWGRALRDAHREHLYVA
ncbi:NADPH-dependent FMN reductase [Salinispora arenicola]|uniref:NADPH-dependent FMN reductase n=1 Tax=Salinispora arenicola (strain CNS-205) TaxID=391037 RepID=A8LW80_SALAI|nr:NAD(P)H-dependent oxidoreductase [Salinispora arenicola]MCN0177845.1 NAD(P)H-dependent oxidoreductase [Salinispora arenicola]NIL56396.1 NAD(P)H-dependent oxidoreductase [Salinispora arenicola]NIL62766.1 NAD(P)H-dependent oxidoreductase [Salinispora arenicola]